MALAMGKGGCCCSLSVFCLFVQKPGPLYRTPALLHPLNTLPPMSPLGRNPFGSSSARTDEPVALTLRILYLKLQPGPVATKVGCLDKLSSPSQVSHLPSATLSPKYLFFLVSKVFITKNYNEKSGGNSCSPRSCSMSPVVRSRAVNVVASIT